MYDKEIYMHGLCQYFALAVNDLLGGTIHLWLDYDEEMECQVLCHAFTEIVPGIFLDAYGVFHNISQREDEFEYNEMVIVSGDSAFAKKVLKDLKVPFTNVQHKKDVREFLRNNELVLKLEMNAQHYLLGIVGHIKPDRLRKGKLLFNSYNISDKSFGGMIHAFNFDEVVNSYKGNLGFIENMGWYYKK